MSIKLEQGDLILQHSPIPIVLSYSTFFTELLTHEHGLWNGTHIISTAAREFLIRVIIYPCLLHRILTPYLDHEVPADEVIQRFTHRVDAARLDPSRPSELEEAKHQLQLACDEFLSSLEITDTELIDAIRSMFNVRNHNQPLNSWLCNRTATDVFTKISKPVDPIMGRSSW